MLADALHAIGAFFHDAAAAHGHVGIAHELELWRLPVLEEQEIEPPHFVRAIIRTIAGADAAVVHHVVQALTAVDGCLHRTNQFARPILPLHPGPGPDTPLR